VKALPEVHPARHVAGLSNPLEPRETTMKAAPAFGALLLTALLTPAQAQETPAQQTGRNMGGGNCSANIYNCADTPNPLPAPNTVWIEEMTWMDVRDALKAGRTTAIISTGGMEPNGPWLVTGKHNYVLRANCDAIARRLGNALCAPIIKLVPEGRIEPPSGHMTSPGTMSLNEGTFRAFLTDVVHSLRMHGFQNIILIGDSGGNQGGQRAVADSLTTLWGGDPVVAHIQEYYDYASVARHMETRGIVDGQGDGLHDDPIIALNMFITDPGSVRYAERVAADKATINGFSIADRVRSLELAREIVAFRAEQTVAAIERAIANRGTIPVAQRGGGGGQQQGAQAGGRGGRGGRGGGGRGGAAGGQAAGQTGAANPPPQPSRNMGGGNCSANTYNCADTPNPLPEANTVWLEEMTWMDVRDAVAAGRTTAILSTGGIEPNGPWLVTGKHNYVLRANCERIARNLGNAVCAPILEYVPEGRIDPPSGHMTSPGTISLREDTYRAVLTDAVHSLRMHGFRNIILIGDSGGNQNGMAAVADTLTARWNGEAAAIHIREYYTAPPGTPNVLRDLGVTQQGMSGDGLHDGPAITLNMMLSDLSSVRWAERVRTDQAMIDGVSIADLGKALEWANAVADARAERTAVLIRERIAARQQ
jgi:creatinine amidohydrolase/Fe(II)-dependent formamide hydrolase-like protein